MILGAILAGGQSRRFGSDKALALLGGRTLIEHVAAAIGGFVDVVVVCGRGDAPPGLATVADWPRPGLGPLGGLCGALRHASNLGYRSVLSVGCDTPVLPREAMLRLVAADRPAFLAESPIIGRWPVSLADELARHLAASEDRSIRRWGASIGAEAIAGEAIPNLNTPGDLARLTAATARGADAARLR